MLFSSIPFLYYFLPLTLLCYFLAPRRAKNAVLLLFSLVFYAWGEPKYVLFMVVSILQGYFFGRLVEKYRISNPRRSKLFLTASVLFSLLLLGYCKYADFFIRSFNAVTGLSVPLLRVALPIGISFYTFQILSYVVDVHRGTVAAQRNLIDLGTYIAMFPQLIAGPIVRYADIEPQLKERRSTPAMVAAGAQRFVLGLGKKVLIANVLYQLITVYKATTQPSVLYSWMYAAAYMLHIYFDFSGYSDMAIGLGKIFGFTFAENFNYPYISRSVTEFWRRWHMSLGRQPGGPGPPLPQYPRGMDADRSLAWRRLELCPVGPVLRCVPHPGKRFPLKAPAKAPRPQPSLYPAAGRGQLCHLR